MIAQASGIAKKIGTGAADIGKIIGIAWDPATAPEKVAELKKDWQSRGLWGRDWPEKDKDPNWGAALGMKSGRISDRDEQYAIIKTPPAGSEIPTRGKRLPFSTEVQGGDVPIDQAKKRGGYYTGRNMEELSRVNEESDNMNNEKNQLSQVAKKLVAKVMEKKRLQEECMPMEMSMESKPHTKEAEDEPGEYDYEGDMAKSQLRSIGYNAKMLHDMLEDNTNLPEWVQSKITLAEDYVVTAANYMEGEMNEAVRGYIKIEPGKEVTGTAIRRPADQAERDQLARNLIANRKYNVGKNIGKKSGSVRSNAAGMTPSQKISTALRSSDTPKELGPKTFPYTPKKQKITPFLSKEAAEGKVAVTPKEKSLAAHHGDKTKNTYGDVIKARLKSAAAKKMGK
jgi:hypothetical protein